MLDLISKEDALKNLTVDDIIENPIRIEEYGYLNICAEKVKEAREKVAEMDAVYEEKKTAMSEADAAYQAAEKELSEAVIAKTVAQTEYDTMVKEEAKKAEEAKKEEAKKAVEAKKAEESKKELPNVESSEKSADTVKTGDPARAGMFMSTAMMGLAGVVAGLKGKFRKKEDSMEA